MQMDLFEYELYDLRREMEELKASHEKVRKGLYSRIVFLEKELINLREYYKDIAYPRQDKILRFKG